VVSVSLAALLVSALSSPKEKKYNATQSPQIMRIMAFHSRAYRKSCPPPPLAAAITRRTPDDNDGHLSRDLLGVKKSMARNQFHQ